MSGRADAGDPLLRHDVRRELRTQSELDPIEAWLKLSAKSAWKMEFQGLSNQAGGGSKRLKVVFRFASPEDAARFERERTYALPAPPVPEAAAPVAKASRSFFSPSKKAAPSRQLPRPAASLPGKDGSGDLPGGETGAAPVDGDTPSSLEDMVQLLVASGQLAGGPAAAMPAPVKPKDTTPASQDPLDAVEFVYRPMWDVRRKVVTSFLCLPAVRSADGQRIIGEAAVAGIETEEIQRQLDLRILGRAAADLLAAFAAGRKHLIAVPVHFETISSTARRAEYLGECRRLHPVAAKRLLFEVVGAPEGMTQSRLLETTTALRLIGRAIMFRTSLWSTNWGDLTQARIASVGADLSQERVSEAAQVERFVRFAEAADKLKLGAYLHGLRSLSLTVSAVGAGFQHLSGQPIADLADAPPDAHHFNLANLYDAMTPSG